MADLTQAYEALKKADAAGNTDDAKQLADYIRSQSLAPVAKSADKPVAQSPSLFSQLRPSEDFDPQATEAQMAQGKVAPDVGKAVAAGALGAMASATGDSPADIETRNKKLRLTTSNPMANELGGLIGSAVAPLPMGAEGSAVARAGNAASTGKPIAQAGQNFTPAVAAQEYVKKLGLEWSKLTDKFKSTLTSIAQDSKRLDKLDPEAVKRKARLDAQGLPATRGQVTRDLRQLTAEENITKSAAGKPVRDINADQDRILHERIDTLRSKTGASASTAQQVGKSVQGASRAKLREAKAAAGEAYTLANKLGEAEVTTVKPLEDFLKDPINDANVGTDIRARLKSYSSEDGQISLKHMEDIRQELTRNAKNPNKGGHYAGEAVKVIDQIMDEAGSSAYKNARSAWKSMKDEFDKQGRVKKLVSEKGMSSDRAVALEDTWDTTIRKGSAEDIEKVQKSLTTGRGNPETLLKGRQAWRDLQGATIDYFKEAASGKRSIPGEKGNLQFNSSFVDAVHEFDADGKLDVIFGKTIAQQMRDLAKVTLDVRTKPAGRIAGSDTAPRILNFLEKLSMVPVIGKYAAGAGKVAQKVAGMGEETLQVAQAKSDPFETEAARSNSTAASQKRKATLRDLASYAPRAAQLADQDSSP